MLTHRLNTLPSALSSDQLLTALLDLSKQFFAVLDLDGHMLLVNSSSLAISNMTAEELRKTPFVDAPWFPDNPAQRRLLEKSITDARKGESSRFDIVNRTDDGRTLIIDYAITPIVDSNNQPEFLLAEGLDLTNEKSIQTALTSERKRVNDILEGTNGGTWDWNVETGEMVVSERWAEIIGKSVDELPKCIDTWIDHVHPDDFPVAQAALDKHFGGESDYYDVEFRQQHADGSWRWVNARGKVVEWDRDNKPLRMRGTHLDITKRKNAEISLGNTLDMYRSLLDALPQNHYRLDENRCITFVNRQFERYTNMSQTRLVGRRMEDIYPPELKEQLCEEDKQILNEGKSYRLTVSFVPNNETDKVYVEIHKFPIRDQDNSITGIQGYFWDVTDTVKAQKSVELAASVFTAAQEGIMLLNSDREIMDVNKAFTRITGFKKKEVIGKSPREFASSRHDESFFEELRAQLQKKGNWHGEVWNKRKDGEVYPVSLNINATHNRAGKIDHLVAVFSDITAMKQQQEQLEKLAHYDALTGLPNRVLLADRLKVAFKQCKRKGVKLGLAYIDLDGFKEINDQYGHDVGDQLLVQVSKRMKKVLRAGDSLARLGGDEFVAVLSDLNAENDAKSVLERINRVMHEEFLVKDKRLYVTASIGVSFYPQEDSIDADQLLRQADQSMYQAKILGKNQYHLFNPERDKVTKGRHESLQNIRLGLSNNEFELYYQPKVNMKTGEIVGAEALARWNHPEKGLLFPGDFVPLLEDNALGVDFGNWAIETALNQAQQWADTGKHIPVSVNLSAYHLQQPNFTSSFKSILDRLGVSDPSLIELEILETSALQDMEHVSNTIAECARLGVGFALDDFGTGYSSLAYLRRLPISTLKIDRSFIADILTDVEDLTLAHAINGFAGAYKLPVVAEGVESIEHGEMLLKMGCHLAQGYGIAKPMPRDKFEQWAQSWKVSDAWKSTEPVTNEKLPLLFAETETNGWLERFKRFCQDEASSMVGYCCQELELWLNRRTEQSSDTLSDLSSAYNQLKSISRDLSPGMCNEKIQNECIATGQALINYLRLNHSQ